MILCKHKWEYEKTQSQPYDIEIDVRKCLKCNKRQFWQYTIWAIDWLPEWINILFFNAKKRWVNFSNIDPPIVIPPGKSICFTVRVKQDQQ